MAAQINIAIVGGGLAGLAAAMKIAEAGHDVDLFSVVPVKRSHSVCAQGGINGAVNTKGEGDSTCEAFRRHGLRRRLSRQPAAGQSNVRNGAGDHLPVRSDGRSVLAYERRACWIFADSAARCIIAQRSRELRLVSSFCTRSTNRCGVGKSQAK